MAYSKITSQDGIKYIVQADTEGDALAQVSAVLTELDPTVSDFDNVNFTLYNAQFPKSYIIKNAARVRWFISAATELLAIAAYNAIPSQSAIKRVALAVGYNFDLLGGVTAFKKIWGVNVHYGDPNADYTQATMDSDIALMKYCNFNSCRTGFKQIYGNNRFLEDGTLFVNWVTKCKANNISVLPVVSMSFAARDPAVKTANWTAKKDSSGYTKAEYLDMFNDAREMGINFVNDRLSLWDSFIGIELGSELDVIDSHTKKISGQGTAAPSIGVYDAASDTTIWTSSYLTTVTPNTIIYPMNYFGMYLNGMAGFITGIRSVKPNTKFVINYSEKHYGTPLAFGGELKRLFNIPLDIVAPHWYSDVENSTDTSGVFISKVTAPNGVPQAGSAIARAKKLIVDKAFAQFILLDEHGYNISKASAFATQKLFVQNVTIPYLKDPDCMGVYWYELKDEPITRATSVVAEQKFGLTQESIDYLHANNPFPIVT